MTSKRGAILFLTLVMATLLLLLSGAFLQINSASFQFTRNVDKDQRATQAALTGVEYARMRLESYQSWGQYGTASNIVLNNAGPWQIWESDNFVASGHREFISVGVLDQGRSHFQIVFVNPSDKFNDTAAGRFQDSDIAAHPSNLGLWRKDNIDARDLSVNYIPNQNQNAPTLTDDRSPGRPIPRTRARVLVMGYCDGVTRRVDTTLGVDVFASAGLASGDKLVVDGNSWEIDSAIADSNRINAGGSAYLPGTAANVLNLNFDQAGSINSQTKIFSNPKNNITGPNVQSSGSIAFSFDSTPPATTVTTQGKGKINPNSGVPAVPNLTAQTVEGWTPSYTNNGTLPAGTYTFSSDHSVRYNGTTVFTDSIPLGTGGAKVILKNHQFIVPNDSKVQVTGSITINSLDSHAPTLAVGYRNDGSLDDNAKGSYLNVQNGNLTVAGSLVGKGSVVVNGTGAPTDNSLNVFGNSQMSASADQGVTVYSQGPVTISSPTAGDFHNSDWNALKPAVMSYAPQTSDKWSADAAPMAQWNKLSQTDQDTYIGGAAVTDDSAATGSYLRNTPMGSASSTPTIVAKLAANFTAYGSNATIQSETEALTNLLTNNQSTPLTPGGYARLNEFLIDSQNAYINGLDLPCASSLTATNSSAWADLTQNNAAVNNYLENELGWFEAQGQNLNGTSWNLETVMTQSTNPLGSTDTRDSQWKGLIYTPQSILMDCGTGTFSLTGSVMAGKDLFILNANRVRTKYDPSYSDSLSKIKVGAATANKIDYVYFTTY